jgi:hypothetical protein
MVFKRRVINSGVRVGELVIMGSRLNLVGVVFVFGALAACAPKPAPIPPPPRVVVAPTPPARPLPPAGAATTMLVPTLGIDGIRKTPNRGISRDESIWHFRSAINVAALNCQGPVWNTIADNYNRYITVHKTRLKTASKTVDGEYKLRYPAENGLRVRDTKMTDLYNYFSLPTVKQEYCDAALAKSTEVLAIPSAALPEYSIGALGDIDGIFIRFFDAYARYEVALADWNQKYAPKPAFVADPKSPVVFTPGT